MPARPAAVPTALAFSVLHSRDNRSIMNQLIQIELPDESSATLQRDASDLGKELRLTAAVKWY
jgi:hypothetical protein